MMNMENLTVSHTEPLVDIQISPRNFSAPFHACVPHHKVGSTLQAMMEWLINNGYIVPEWNADGGREYECRIVVRTRGR